METTNSRPRAVLPQLAIWFVVLGFVGMLAGWGGRIAIGALALGFVLIVALIARALFRMLR